MKRIIVACLFSAACINAGFGQGAMTAKQQNVAFPNQVTNAGSSKPSTQLFETWLPWMGMWRNSDFQNYTYNTSQFGVSQTDKGWDTLSNSWINNSKDTFEYDGMNRVVLHLTQTWNGAFQ